MSETCRRSAPSRHRPHQPAAVAVAERRRRGLRPDLACCHHRHRADWRPRPLHAASVPQVGSSRPQRDNRLHGRRRPAARGSSTASGLSHLLNSRLQVRVLPGVTNFIVTGQIGNEGPLARVVTLVPGVAQRSTGDSGSICGQVLSWRGPARRSLPPPARGACIWSRWVAPTMSASWQAGNQAWRSWRPSTNSGLLLLPRTDSTGQVMAAACCGPKVHVGTRAALSRRRSRRP